MLEGEESWNQLSHRVLGCCLVVHKTLGPGLLESVYADSLSLELTKQGLSHVREYPVPVLYSGEAVGDPLRIDFLVEDTLVVEVKAVEQIHRVHSAQVLTYLKLAAKPLGLLINFNTALLREGITRLILTADSSRSSRGTAEAQRRTEMH